MASLGMNPALSGAVDLSSLVNKHRAPTPPPVSPGSQASSNLIREADDQTVGALVELSRTVAVILEIYGGELTPVMGPLIESYQGKFVLGTIRGENAPELIQALQIKGVPTIVALVGGQPIPLMQGIAPEEEMRPLLAQVLELAEKSGVTGSVTPSGESAELIPEEPPLPPLHQEAFDALTRDDIPGAKAAYNKALTQNPADADAQVGLAQVELLERVRALEADTIRATAADSPSDLSAALGVADLDMSTGRVSDACARLLGIYPELTPEDQSLVRERLLSFFLIGGPTSDEVKRARSALTSLMF